MKDISEIVEMYHDEKISKRECVQYLKSLCEVIDNRHERTRCIRKLSSIIDDDEDHFRFFEYFAVSDSETIVRIEATKTIINTFPEKALKMVKLLLNHIRLLKYTMALYQAVWSKKMSLKGTLRKEYQKMEDSIREKLEGTGIPLSVWKYELAKIERQLKY